MDLSAEVEKLTCETAALRNEIWELKELLNRQNERILFMLQRQNDMLNGMEGDKTNTLAEVATPSQKVSTPSPIKESPKSNTKTTRSSRSTTKSETTTYTAMEIELLPNYEPNQVEDTDESEDYGYEDYFPIKTQKHLDRLERKITELNKSQWINALKNKFDHMDIWTKFTLVLSLELILEYNLDGRQNKKRLLDYPKLLDILYKGTKTNLCTRAMFYDQIRKCLQLEKKKHFKKKSILNKKKREMAQLDDIFS